MRSMNWILSLGLVLAALGCDQDTITKDPSNNADGPAAALPGAPSDVIDEDAGGGSAAEPDAVASAGDGATQGGDAGNNGQSNQQLTGAPDGYATLTFSVDDSANETYEGGQMRWTGSFSWDESDNTIEYAASWLPEDGPYPVLYDDGPLSEGGHEREGAVAGDHIFTTEVYVKAEETVEFEYGLLNEFDNWIWIGPNGIVTVEAGSTEIINLPGMSIPSFGDIDCKLTLNINEGELNDSFTKDKNGNPIPIAKVFVKGTMNSWAPVQLLDNGTAPDEVAGDGIYTYHHLESLGPHDGGLSAGGEVQFVFMLGVDPEGFAEDASEYKAMGDALPDGVKAYTDAENPGEWSEVPVILSQDSKGNTLNTAFVVPGVAVEEPQCDEENVCEAGLVCAGGVCSECASSADCSENEKCVEGVCTVAEDAECEVDADCGDGSICEDDECVEQPVELTPCDENGGCLDGFNCEDNVCVPEAPPVSEPQIFILTPTSGSKAGGTTVSVIGEDFQEGALLSFGGNAASNVVFVSETELSCKTPAVTPGIVDVVVVNPDGGEYSFDGAFTFTNEDPPPTEPTVKGPIPAAVAPKGGTSIAITGWVLETVTTVKLDGQETEFEWVNGAPTFTAPAASLGDALELSVVLEDGTELTSPKPLRYGHVASPQLDGINSPDEWPYLLTVNAIPTSWGDNVNELSTAWAAFDETYLYIAFEAYVEKADGTPSNALVVYLDKDFGTGTGVSDCNTLNDKDGSGNLDQALSGGLVINVEGFGADLAAGTVGTNSVVEGEGFSPWVGWRMLDDLSNFSWIQGTVASGTDGWIEMAIPYSVLFSDGQVPSGGTTIGAFAVIGNKWGSEYSNQSLPSQDLEGSTVSEAESVMTFELLEME